ncbi:MAG: type II secretion system GspH family protein, partial [Clostridiales bacterium]|nr:type II secretion system GspH family protein [Clostridiales bacterium]
MRNESGFSLLEIVISTAVLAILSGFILQMFIASIRLNQRAYDLDMSSNVAAEALETLKADETPEGGAAEKFYDSRWNQTALKNAKFILTTEVFEEKAYGA